MVRPPVVKWLPSITAALRWTAGCCWRCRPISMLGLNQCLGVGQCSSPNGRATQELCLPALLCLQ